MAISWDCSIEENNDFRKDAAEHSWLETNLYIYIWCTHRSACVEINTPIGMKVSWLLTNKSFSIIFKLAIYPFVANSRSTQASYKDIGCVWVIASPAYKYQNNYVFNGDLRKH